VAASLRYSQRMRRTAETHDRIVRELNQERAAALRRISGVLEGLIAQLHQIRASLSELPQIDQARTVARYREVRALALQYRWYLEVQREAMGLRQHQRLDEFYKIPPEIL